MHAIPNLEQVRNLNDGTMLDENVLCMAEFIDMDMNDNAMLRLADGRDVTVSPNDITII